MKIKRWQKLLLSGTAVLLAGFGVTRVMDEYRSLPVLRQVSILPTRDDHLKALKSQEYDILVIGGGATGAGIALDATTRGLRTALVELDDFSSGTSSKSSKLVHGGLRYLQKAILELDLEQFQLVKDSLLERRTLLTIAPHLVHPIPIILPIYNLFMIPYYWMGVKAYDLVSGTRNIGWSYFVSKRKSLELFPTLEKQNLKGSIVFYDGQQDDTRMNITIIKTAVKYGANVANHVEVISLLKKDGTSGEPKVCGVKVKDNLTGEEWDIYSKCVINATGPFTDTLRRMDNEDCESICKPSSGVHIILPKYYTSKNIGLLIPSTKDGRILFVLPWRNVTLVGTTDEECDVTFHPEPTESDIDFILSELKDYISQEIGVRRGDIMSSWCGIRPLVHNPSKKSTESLARSHVIEVSLSKLITIAGGKWTSYRSMAEQTVNKAIEECLLQPERKCCTSTLVLDGSIEWTPLMPMKLIQEFGFEHDVAVHLSNTYGTEATTIARMCSLTGKKKPFIGKRLHQDFPYLEVEVKYAIQEYACTAIDVIARRLRISLINADASIEILPNIISMMSKEFQWDKNRQKEEYEKALTFIRHEMGQKIKRSFTQSSSLNLTERERSELVESFKGFDFGGKGYIDVYDLRRILQKRQQDLSDESLKEIIAEVGTAGQYRLTMDEYLQLMTTVKTGELTLNRMATILRQDL